MPKLATLAALLIATSAGLAGCGSGDSTAHDGTQTDAAGATGISRAVPTASPTVADPPAASASQSPSHSTPDPSSSAAPRPTAPVAYVVGKVVHLPGGTTVTLHTPLPPHGFVRLDDGRFAVVTGDDQADRIAVTRSDGSLLDSYPVSGGLVVNADRTAVGWVDPDGDPQVMQAGRRDPVQLKRISDRPVSDVQPVALFGSDCTADAETKVGAGCEMIGNMVVGGRPTTFTVDSHGIVEAYGGRRVTAISDVSPSRTVDLEYTDEESDGGYCTAVYDQSAAAYGAKTCGYSGLVYGPEGDVVAGTPNSDGPGPSALYLFSPQSLAQPIARTPDDGATTTYFDQTFADDTHLVAIAAPGDGTAHLVTLDAAGSYRDLGVVGRATEDHRDVFLEVMP